MLAASSISQYIWWVVKLQEILTADKKCKTTDDCTIGIAFVLSKQDHLGINNWKKHWWSNIHLGSTFFLMRKAIPKGRKWLLRLYFPLIGGIFVLKSGLRFSFRARTESEEKTLLVGESGLFLTLSSGTSSARNENLRPLFNRNISLIRGKYGLKNHFWPLESPFSHFLVVRGGFWGHISH